jgi:23S rRNA (uridine2552-2'-O)-methyltransferase
MIVAAYPRRVVLFAPHQLRSAGASRLKHNKQSKSSQNWIQRQQKDPYVQKAQALGLPSRASFKLQEINEIHYPALIKKKKGISATGTNKRLLQPQMNVVDLGASPGGWSLYASTQVKEGIIVAVDLLPLDDTKICLNLPNFEFIRGDFTESETKQLIIDALKKERAHLVMSDMAQNFLGDSQTDALRTLNLCEQALVFSAGGSCFDSSYSPKADEGMLAPGGSFLCKFFSCGKEYEEDLMQAAKRAFRSVHVIKPKASRKESSEMYLLAINKRS